MNKYQLGENVLYIDRNGNKHVVTISHINMNVRKNEDFEPTIRFTDGTERSTLLNKIHKINSSYHNQDSSSDEELEPWPDIDDSVKKDENIKKNKWRSTEYNELFKTETLAEIKRDLIHTRRKTNYLIEQYKKKENRMNIHNRRNIHSKQKKYKTLHYINKINELAESKELS